MLLPPAAPPASRPRRSISAQQRRPGTDQPIQPLSHPLPTRFSSRPAQQPPAAADRSRPDPLRLRRQAKHSRHAARPQRRRRTDRRMRRSRDSRPEAAAAAAAAAARAPQPAAKAAAAESANPDALAGPPPPETNVPWWPPPARPRCDPALAAQKKARWPSPRGSASVQVAPRARPALARTRRDGVGGNGMRANGVPSASGDDNTLRFPSLPPTPRLERCGLVHPPPAQRGARSRKGSAG